MKTLWSNSSNFCSSISILLLLLAASLLVISLVDFTLSPERASAISLQPPWKWRIDSFSSYSLALNAELDINGTSGDHLVQEQEKPSTRSLKSKLQRIEAALAKARSLIREAAQNKNMTSVHQDPDYVPQGPIYRNANAFHRSYLEMEKLMKIYVYEEGETPLFHNGPCRSIYSSEGRFIMEMEKGSFYRTRDPNEALLYFLPFSVVMMVQYLYVPGAPEFHAIGRTVADYIHVISRRHPFWNRSLGADHFMLSCHDWAPHTSSYVPDLFNNSIRALCNANTSEGFNPSKDVSLPEIHLKTGEISGLLGGPSPSKRPLLAFFAGRLHGHIRRVLLDHWKQKDPDLFVVDELPAGVSYESMLRKSRFCLCPSGYEVASPRVVEAIYGGCVPVLISDGYVPPFSDVLNWKAFSVAVPAREITNLKKILTAISRGQYLRMQRRVKLVQRHFVINGAPKRFDVFHMIIHSIWLRRLNIQIHD
ncbi:probable glycosyltransferase At5g03795 [Diospyros lotus]|uniref:probable glycosyltransferase At5g03795 n=1 Tax=Diospyros lotus TaxID=55363 RepID=UPI002259150D|nr:probable glycosyltransferase At5g03795 [Diospyros lotus]